MGKETKQYNFLGSHVYFLRKVMRSLNVSCLQRKKKMGLEGQEKRIVQSRLFVGLRCSCLLYDSLKYLFTFEF